MTGKKKKNKKYTNTLLYIDSGRSFFGGDVPPVGEQVASNFHTRRRSTYIKSKQRKEKTRREREREREKEEENE